MYAGYRKSNVLRTIRGTVIEQDIQNMLMGSSKMREIMKNMKRPILIDRLAEGGLSKDRFDCQLRLYGLKQGKAYVSGTFD